MFPFVVSRKRQIAKNAEIAPINTKMAEVIRKRKKKTRKNNVRLSEGAQLCGDIGEINSTESNVEQECAE